ncbi:Uncharacterized protein APZ42_034206 [Daphnia magna]|uniref:Uncharacterized protein n=1 Tax=Daphnia magna TaxID=35525 RepID=A0A164KCB0_9CRUS|nr:Uncharacterized protein APZ42_034206 [Daphnia magna]
MSETHRLEHLFRNSITLFKKIYLLKPKICEEFFALAKSYIKASLITGAAVTVISPELLEKTEFVRKPLLLTKDSSRKRPYLSPQSTADILVTDRGKTIKGNAIVMPITGFELLLRNDFLQQFRAFHIDYESEESSFTTGKSPLAEITSLHEEQSQESRLVSRDRQEIPAYTVKQIPAIIFHKIRVANLFPNTSNITLIPLMLPESINFLTRVPGKNELLFKIKWKECCVEESSNLLIALGLPQWFSQEKNDTWRFCVDYRKLNAVTVKDSFPLPRIVNTLSQLKGILP